MSTLENYWYLHKLLMDGFFLYIWPLVNIGGGDFCIPVVDWILTN